MAADPRLNIGGPERNLLSIQFETPEDLASKLFELSQAMANDWENFQKIAGEA